MNADGDADADATGELGPCDPARGPVEPVGTGDVTYGEVERTACRSEPCLCTPDGTEEVERLLACDAVGVGWFEDFGSFYARVVGRADGACLVDVGIDREGSAGLYRCTLPLPIAAWDGLRGELQPGSVTDPLEGIADRCTQTGSCCLLGGCPNPCTDAVPLCPPSGSLACPAP